MKGLAMTIREVICGEGEPYIGPGPGSVCAISDCGGEPCWEIQQEDLQTIDPVTRVDMSPAGPLIDHITVRYYCNDHAKQICLEEGIELPERLA
jgi:hypothetical protein